MQYDRNRSGALEVEEFQHLLADLGLLVSVAFGVKHLHQTNFVCCV